MEIQAVIDLLNREAVTIRKVDSRLHYVVTIQGFSFSVDIHKEKQEDERRVEEVWYCDPPLHEENKKCPVCEQQNMKGRPCPGLMTEDMFDYHVNERFLNAILDNSDGLVQHMFADKMPEAVDVLKEELL